VKRESDCSYLTPQPRRKPTPSGLDDFNEYQPVQVSSHQPSQISWLQEMRLFHHAILVTAPSLASDEVDLHFCQWDLPWIATAHDHVMDGLLALAALHIAFLEPDKLSFWSEVALTYQTRAIMGLREYLAIKPEKYEAAFTGSLLILVLVTAYPGICQDTGPVDPLSELLTIRSVLQGCAITFKQIYCGQERTRIDYWIHRDKSTKKANSSET
jgi:hypothetical protein